LMAQNMVGSVVTGEDIPPMPARRNAWAIYELFETSDGEQIFIGITSDNHWERFCTHFSRPELVSDPRYGSNEERVRERPALVPIVAEIIKRHTKAEMLEIAERIGIPFAPVATTLDLFDDPHLVAGNRLLEVELGGGLRSKIPKLPLEVGEHNLTLRTQPPAMGSHTREALEEIGISAPEILRLESRGIIGCGDKTDAAD
ncbi:MAG: CoA transferase, partial [bacterium]